MSWVVARPGEAFEALLRRFKKAVEYSGVLADYRKHEAFEKPSVQRKRKQAAAKKRAMKRQRKTDGRAKFSSNQNFRWNKEHTEKIPLPPPSKTNYNRKPQSQRPQKPNSPRPQYTQNKQRPNQNSTPADKGKK